MRSLPLRPFVYDVFLLKRTTRPLTKGEIS
jgi:hypothetical protein